MKKRFYQFLFNWVSKKLKYRTLSEMSQELGKLADRVGQDYYSIYVTYQHSAKDDITIQYRMYVNPSRTTQYRDTPEECLEDMERILFPTTEKESTKDVII